jgi:glutamyl-Q tRNA(Asp) synthetase
MAMSYVGRFAPSPTGPLHFGSLVAATGSFLQARSHQGKWLVRIEDIDPPREVAGASTEILRTLENFGLEWDGPVRYQSTRSRAYDDAIESLRGAGALYACGCSRKEIAATGGPIYPGTCRGRPLPSSPHALRVNTCDAVVEFEDAIQGTIRQELGNEVGDFVVRRADGLYAYQLAVVVDDAEQWVTEVVRGSDLLYSTPRQIHLQHLLGFPTPAYVHLPVAVNAAGEKLSKQTFAAPIDRKDPIPAIIAALSFLGQDPPREMREGNLTSIWRWAIDQWRLGKVPRQLSIEEREQSS